MTTSKTHCSSRAGRPSRRPRIVVIEGIPGAGKTTVLRALATYGHTVVGEYLADDGQLLDMCEHPVTDDDVGHLRNLLRKHRQVNRVSDSTVYCDRDWLSALAYAASVDDRNLLAERAQWVAARLHQGTLAIPDLYIVFDLDVDASLARRAARLDPGHPWATREGIRRLRDFYHAPAAHVAVAHRRLGRLVSAVQTVHLPAASQQTLVRQTLQAVDPV